MHLFDRLTCLNDQNSAGTWGCLSMLRALQEMSRPSEERLDSQSFRRVPEVVLQKSIHKTWKIHYLHHPHMYVYNYMYIYIHTITIHSLANIACFSCHVVAMCQRQVVLLEIVQLGEIATAWAALRVSLGSMKRKIFASPAALKIMCPGFDPKIDEENFRRPWRWW